jgi:hypothetical protein
LVPLPGVKSLSVAGDRNRGTRWRRLPRWRHGLVPKDLQVAQHELGTEGLCPFDGICLDGTVYLNGTQIGDRPYGFSSFECDLGSNAKSGASNALAVNVKARRTALRSTFPLAFETNATLWPYI